MKKMKRYQEGGEAEGISGTAGRMTTTEAKKPRTTDDMTFGQAFRAARKAGKKTFGLYLHNPKPIEGSHPLSHYNHPTAS